MVIPSGCSPRNISATSSRVNQRASSSSSRSTVISVEVASRVAADHQRHRERPGLRGEILHARRRRCRLPQRLAPRRVLDAFARLDEARKARPHVGDEAPRAPEQAVVAVDREHDHDRIGAREMLDLALGHSRFQPACDDVGRRAAIRAEAVPRMPGEQRLGFGERRQMIRRRQGPARRSSAGR